MKSIETRVLKLEQAIGEYTPEGSDAELAAAVEAAKADPRVQWLDATAPTEWPAHFWGEVDEAFGSDAVISALSSQTLRALLEEWKDAVGLDHD
jgi:hypothetical protein